MARRCPTLPRRRVRQLPALQRVEHTVRSVAIAPAYASSADLPTPGSPRRQSAARRPRRAASKTSVMSTSSSSRPTSAGIAAEPTIGADLRTASVRRSRVVRGANAPPRVQGGTVRRNHVMSSGDVHSGRRSRAVVRLVDLGQMLGCIRARKHEVVTRRYSRRHGCRVGSDRVRARRQHPDRPGPVHEEVVGVLDDVVREEVLRLRPAAVPTPKFCVTS